MCVAPGEPGCIVDGSIPCHPPLPMASPNASTHLEPVDLEDLGELSILAVFARVEAGSGADFQWLKINGESTSRPCC